ncbi:MAG: exodeoxyribonuclease small subunit [Microbacteriaceae bacterium]|nr:exodeoxyribonuclease small subunit [Microbacteriaceae bacterium]
MATTPSVGVTSNADVAELSYEDSRDELVRVVHELEQGSSTLEQSLALWERGEALAKHCEEWLIGAKARLDKARLSSSSPASANPASPGSDTSSSDSAHNAAE